MADPTTLDQALERYHSGKAFGRGDMFAFIVKDMTEFRERLGNVDADAVQELADRLTALEGVIGRALGVSAENGAEAPKPRRGRPPNSARSEVTAHG